MKLLLLIITTIVTFNSYASQCNYSDYFSSAQLKALDNANNYYSKDWLSKILNLMDDLGDHEFTIAVLHNPSLDKYLVLLGEFHIKGRKASKLGRKLVNTFDYRLFELVPSREAPKSKISLASFISPITSVASGRIFDSTIFDLILKGLTVLPRQSNPVLLDGYSITNFKNTAANNVSTVLDIYNTIVNKSSITLDHVNLPLEVGKELIYSDEMSYVLDERNIRMAGAVTDYYNSNLPINEAIAVVGAAHVSGLIEILADSGFVLCDKE